MVSASAVMKEGMQEWMLLNIIPSMSADPLKGDAQSCQNKSEEDIPKSSPFDFVIKQFQGKRSSSGKRKEQPSAIQKFFSGFDFGKSEGKERQETEETLKNNCRADDQSEKENLPVEGNADTVNKSVWLHFNFIENCLLFLLDKMWYSTAYNSSFSQNLLLVETFLRMCPLTWLVPSKERGLCCWGGIKLLHDLHLGLQCERSVLETAY